MLSDLLAVLGLAKEIRQLTRRPADGINFNIVKAADKAAPEPGDHLRIVNLLPVSICEVRFFLQEGKDGGPGTAIKYVYHPSTNELPFGERVTYQIPVEPVGVFLYPQGMYYVPLKEYPSFNWDGDVWVRFSYNLTDKGKQEGNPQKAARANVIFDRRGAP